jgi:pimeloyl-ACP methyl ester carboxylesterase
MGGHTALAFALRRPERVSGLVIITPAFDGRPTSPERLSRWDALASGLRSGGIDGFLAAQGEPTVQPAWRDTVIKVIRQRFAGHQHLDAVADALSAVPRSMPFPSLDALTSISAPTAIVASNDEADPEHPFAIGEAYASLIPGARLVRDEPGRSPVAWQGSQLSKVIADVAGGAG